MMSMGPLFGLPVPVFNTCAPRACRARAFSPACVFAPVPGAVGAFPMDVFETPDAFKITVDTPGFDAGDISITLQDGVLTIAGKKKAASQEHGEQGRVLRRERALSAFSRSVTVPDSVDAAGVAACLHNGVLELTLPKVAPPEPKNIPVTTPEGHAAAVGVNTEAPAHKDTAASGEAAAGEPAAGAAASDEAAAGAGEAAAEGDAAAAPSEAG